jgi:hypothetical protein
MREPDHEPDDEGIRQRPQRQPRKTPADDAEEPTPARRILAGAVVRTQQSSSNDPYQTHFPPWAGPVGGVLVFGSLAAYASFEREGQVSPTIALGGAAAGLFIGTIVWLCDRPSGRGKSLDVADQGTFVGRFLALLSGFLFCLPFIGLFLSGWAVYLNRRRSAGWPWLVSRVTFALAALLTVVFVVLLLLDKRER